MRIYTTIKPITNLIKEKNMMNRNLVNRPLDFLEAIDGLFNTRSITNERSLLAVDVHEDEKKYTVLADTPGVSKDNIKISFDKGQLSIDIEERKVKETNEGEKVIMAERFYTKKTRVLNFGDNVDSEGITANYKDGVLQLEIPKREAVNTLKQIAIN